MTYDISVPRLQDILRGIYSYLGEHQRHTAYEQRQCGCDPLVWIEAGADVPEYDDERTLVGRLQERGPLGFALTDGTWIQYGGNGYEAVRLEDPDDRRSAVTWYVGPRGMPMQRVASGGWQARRS